MKIPTEEEIVSAIIASKRQPVGCIESDFTLCSIVEEQGEMKGFRLERGGRAFEFLLLNLANKISSTFGIFTK